MGRWGKQRVSDYRIVLPPRGAGFMKYQLFWAVLYGNVLLVMYAIAGTAVALWSVSQAGSVTFVCLIVIGILLVLASKK